MMTKKAPLQMVWSQKEKDWLFSYDRRPQDGGMLYGFMRAGMRSVAKLHPKWPISREQEMKFSMSGQEPYVSDEIIEKLFIDELKLRGFDPETFKIICKRPKIVEEKK